VLKINEYNEDWQDSTNWIMNSEQIIITRHKLAALLIVSDHADRLCTDCWQILYTNLFYNELSVGAGGMSGAPLPVNHNANEMTPACEFNLRRLLGSVQMQSPASAWHIDVCSHLHRSLLQLLFHEPPPANAAIRGSRIPDIACTKQEGYAWQWPKLNLVWV